MHASAFGGGLVRAFLSNNLSISKSYSVLILLERELVSDLLVVGHSLTPFLGGAPGIATKLSFSVSACKGSNKSIFLSRSRDHYDFFTIF